MLKRKAEEGVKIYVIAYKEVVQTMTMSSHHTKETLDALHPNVACMRHPDHIGSKGKQLVILLARLGVTTSHR